jgi:hypothetical protein
MPAKACLDGRTALKKHGKTQPNTLNTLNTPKHAATIEKSASRNGETEPNPNFCAFLVRHSFGDSGSGFFRRMAMEDAQPRAHGADHRRFPANPSRQDFGLPLDSIAAKFPHERQYSFLYFTLGSSAG